jgi:hypothetical protein
MMTEMERAGGRVNIPRDERIAVAPMIIVVGFLILAGFILGLALPTGLPRIIATGLPALACFVILIVQAAAGFPVKTNVDRANRDRKVDPFAPPAFPAPGPFGPPFRPGDRLEVSTTPWYWLTAVFSMGVVGALLIEHLAIFRTRGDALPEEDFD